MAGTADMLRSTLGPNGFDVLRAVAESPEPASGRAIAAALKLSPTTATTRLSQLGSAGFVRSSRSGRSLLWRLNTDNEIVRAWLRESRNVVSPVAEEGSSPVSTGGGGVTFERQVAADYLARLLLGDGATGLGPSRVVVSLAFQQAPEFAVDDLVVGAAVAGEDEPSVLLTVAARRTPNVVDSDVKSRKLFRAFLKQVLETPADGPELRLGLAVAGPQDHASQLALLATVAAAQSNPQGFFDLVRTPKKYDDDVRGRLIQVEKLVRRALVDLGLQGPADAEVELQAWRLLSRLMVTMPRMGDGDDADWSAVSAALKPVSHGGDLYGGTLLRDRLLTLAGDWAPVAASVNVSMLRRAVHDLLDSAARRHRDGWRALDLLSAQARAAVGDEIVSADGTRRIRVDREDVSRQLWAAIDASAAVVVHGESGVGKSAATLGLLTGTTTVPVTEPAPGGVGRNAGAADPDRDLQVVSINLRHVLPAPLQFEAALKAPLQRLLAEMSAPVRILIVDGADAVAEGAQALLTYVVGAAVAADVKVVAVTASDAKQLVADTVAVGLGVVEVAVPPLTDAQIDAVVSEFGELEVMASNPRSRELLRRPIVADLLVRGDVQGVPLSDFDAMQQIWDGLVHRGGPGRGSSDSRNVVMLQVARQGLRTGRDQVTAAAELDPIAVAGLRKDGLLRTSQDNPFRPMPEFTHDEVRRYAVARLLLAEDEPTTVLVDAGVPRWTLGAARLACQGLLAAPDSIANSLAGRFVRWQARFDELVAAGHGERWTDVPGEALLTLADPRTVLREAWPQLRTDAGSGVQRLFRLADQRLRGPNGLLRVAAVEPLIEQLLDEGTPWRTGDGERTLLRDWLRSAAVTDVPEGYRLRERLRGQLVEFCAAADERLQAAERARIAKRESSAGELRTARRAPLVVGEIGYPRGRTRRERPVISREITDETVVELFALLGPDLGIGGAMMLRRIADASPEDLAAAVEGIGCGRALARFQRGFLAEMVLAYYLDEEDDGNGGDWEAEGVRDHRFLGGRTPLAAWYRGPFMPLLQTDFRNGVAVLNKILNHAAAVRSRTLAAIDRNVQAAQHVGAEQYETELDIAGAARVFVGDEGTWNWYRGTGVGPYPCMSALQALERVCDELIKMGMPLRVLIPMLLDGCANVAMVGLVVGILVRHLEQAETMLDPFLAEPEVWQFEFARIANEYGWLPASSEGVAGADRRQWSLREAATSLVLSADAARADELKRVGHQLVARARRRLEQLGAAIPADATILALSTVRGWASSLDSGTYTLRQVDRELLIESHPPPEVAAVLAEGMGDLLRSQEATRLMVRYHVKQENGTAEQITAGDLVADVDSAAALLEDPPQLTAMGWDAPTAVAAYALVQHLVYRLPLPDHTLATVAEIALRVGEDGFPPRDYEIPESYFSQGADRSAARALPLLLIDEADHVRRLVDGKDGSSAFARTEAAVTRLAHATALETRLFLARGLDPVWAASCAQDAPCMHHAALRITIDMLRECVLGPWDVTEQKRRVLNLDDPVLDTLPALPGESIYVARLDASIRALAAAAVADTCVSDDARVLLATILAAQRRALLTDGRRADLRGTHALVAARALLTLGDDTAIFDHIEAYLERPDLLEQTLRALRAAAEENAQRAGVAHRIWPAVMEQVIVAVRLGQASSRANGRDRDDTLAALLPAPTANGIYLYSEVVGDPIVWWDPVAWQGTVERWLDVAAGASEGVDALVSFVASSLPIAEQARIGVPWVARAVLAAPAAVANRCYVLTSWLVEVRAAVESAGLTGDWQRTVDALVVAGDNRLAPYSE